MPFRILGKSPSNVAADLNSERNSAVPVKQIALLYPVSVSWMGEFFMGLTSYASEHGEWSILTSPPTLNCSAEKTLTLHSLQDWPGDGVITAITSAAEVKAAQALHLPVVNIGGAIRDPHIPTVTLDHLEIGRVAADHLLKCGFRRLAYYGIKKLWYSQQRLLGFQQRARESEIPVDVYEEIVLPKVKMTWSQSISNLLAWLKNLELPLGLMAVHDFRARVVIDACNRLGIMVPHDLAVIGVDNDPSVCEYCRPALSSVARNNFRQGYETARLLDRLMSGRALESPLIHIPPTSVVSRSSTDTITTMDPHITSMIRYMHKHVGEPFGIKEIMRLVPISRRRLEILFHHYLRCTPYKYLLCVRVDNAKQMLAGPVRVNIEEIAARCGFSNSKQFRIIFKRLTGQSPRQFASLRNIKKLRSENVARQRR